MPSNPQKNSDIDLRLGQFLKLAGLCQTGGEGKLMIQNGEVKVNGEVEVRRGRHLCLDDVVTACGQSIKVSSVI